jgi:hypothetical protein
MTTTALSSHLRETLAQSRHAIDAWVAAERKNVDQQVANARQEISAKQRAIDTASAQLLALQLEYGCNLNIKKDDNGENSFDGKKKISDSLSQKRTELETKVQNQTSVNQQIEAQNEELLKQLEGMPCYSCFMICGSFIVCDL